MASLSNTLKASPGIQTAMCCFMPSRTRCWAQFRRATSAVSFLRAIKRWKDADSSIFLNLALEEIQNAGYRIVNVDTTLVLAAPKIGPIAAEMRERVADLLGIKPADVGIKAKTPEGLNADHVAQAHAVVLLEKAEDADELGALTASIESEQQMEDVVQDLVSQAHGREPRPTIKPVFDTEDIT